MTTIANLRHQITIEQPVNTPDGAGGFTRAWQTFLSGWAEIAPKTASQRFFAQKLEHIVTHTITLRYRQGLTITNDMRVNYTIGSTTRYFQIHGIFNVDERNRFTTLLCQEGVGS